MQLAKPRLTALIVLSAMSAYALAPYPVTLGPLLALTVGTSLCAGSANAINMAREPEFDRLMSRTRQRPVASGQVSPKQAFMFALLTGATGAGVLAAGTTMATTALGIANIYLYGGLYTTMKRTSIANTWVGAVVGAIPPLMGWATSSSLALWDPGAWILAGLLFSWQFPHFMSLSYMIGPEYKRAGYIMAGWKNPPLATRASLRHSLAMFPWCIGLWYFGVTDPFFILDSSLVNIWLVVAAFQFWRQQLPNSAKLGYNPQDKSYARKLFLASVAYLPIILVLAMIHKKGQWDWLWAMWTPENVENTEN